MIDIQVCPAYASNSVGSELTIAFSNQGTVSGLHIDGSGIVSTNVNHSPREWVAGQGNGYFFGIVAYDNAVFFYGVIT